MTLLDGALEERSVRVVLPTVANAAAESCRSQKNPILEGLDVIAHRLGVADRHTVIAYAERRVDPLRLRVMLSRYWIRADRLDLWKLRTFGSAEERLRLPRIVGLQRIAQQIGRKNERAVREFARRTVDPLPVVGLGGRSPWVYESASVDWLDAQDRPYSWRGLDE